ncbi:MAG: hypothetical protein ACE5LG_00350 [Anaerolineae bacterium]
MTRVAILHYAAPPIVGSVESTIYHHARVLAQPATTWALLPGAVIKIKEMKRD